MVIPVCRLSVCAPLNRVEVFSSLISVFRLYESNKLDYRLNFKQPYTTMLYKSFHLLLPRDAMHSAVVVIVNLSACPSVRLSVCHNRAPSPHGSAYDGGFFTI